MALTDRDIVITPNKGASSEPNIVFTGADAASSASITLKVLNAGTQGTLSFEGTSGQLLAITDSMSGTIFSVNDISGIPSLEVYDTGEVRLAEFGGYVYVANTTNATSTTNGALRVAGGVGIAQDLRVGGTIYGNVSGTITSSASSAITNDPSNAATHYLTFVSGTSGNLPIKVDGSTLAYVPSTNRLGIGRTPSFSLDVAGQTSPLQTVARFGTASQDITITHSSPIIAANAYYNSSWLRSGGGLASLINFGPGSFDFQTSVTNAAGGTSISDFTSRLYISNAGNVGINTTSPGARLEVKDGDIWLNAPAGGNPTIRFIDDGGYSAAGFQIQYNNTTGSTTIDNVYNTTGAGIYFRTRTGGTAQNVMTLMNNRVGLGGVTSPSYAIDADITANYMRLNSGANYGGIMMYQNGAARGYLGMAWSTNDYISGSTQGDLTLRAESDLILAANSGNNASQLFLSSNSNIGVGTNAPSSPIHVYRSVNATDIPDMLRLQTYRADFTAIGGSAILFKNQDGNNGTNEARIKSVTENNGALGINNEASSSFIFNMTNGGTATDRVIFRGDGRVGIGTMVPGELLDVNGVANVASHITQGPLISRPNASWGATGTTTGAVIIKFPGGTGNYGMVHVVIDVYTYDGNHASTIIVGGHNWNGQWYNYGASVVGSFTKGIRVGTLGGQYCITLGNNSTSWSYGQVVVRKIQNGSYYSGIMDLSGTYTVYQDAASDASYTWISAYLATTGSGSGINADLLDGIDSTQFLRSDTTDYQTGGTLYFNGGTLDTSTYDSYASMRVIRNNGGANNDGMYIGYANAGSAITRIYGGGATGGAFEKYSNYSYEPGSFRAPIFYDSNNTGYYADFTNGTTSVFQLGNTVYNQYGRGPTGLYSSYRYQLVFSMGTAYQLPADGTTTGNLYGIAWSHPNAGGTASNLASHGLLMLENGSFRGAWGGGSLRTTSDIRGTIYYDYNDTGYYTDLNSNSTAYATRIRSGMLMGPNYTWGAYLLVGGNGKYSYGQNSTNIASVVTTDGNLHLDSGSGKSTYINYYDGSNVYFCDGSNNIRAQIASDGTFRSPIFYDYNNTGYYADPASTSVFNALTLNSLTLAGRSLGTSVAVDMRSFGVNTYYPVTFSIPSGRTTTIRIENALTGQSTPSWGTHPSGFSLYLEWTTNGSGWGTIGVNRWIKDWRESWTSVTIVGGITQLTNSSTEVVWLRGGGYYNFTSDNAISPVARSSTYTVSSQSVSPSTTIVSNPYDTAGGTMAYGSYWANSDMRSPIYYDKNDTGYYINPNSTSNIIRLDGDEINLDGGTRNNANDATLYVTATNNNDWAIIVNKNRSSATEYGIDVRMGSSYNYGLRVLGGGSEHARLSSDYFYHFSDIRTPIFYDSADTGYYANLNDWSRMWGIGTYYLRNNYGVSTDHPFGLYFDNGLSSAYAIYRESGAWTNPYPDLRIAFHTGIKMGANASYNGMRFYDDYNMATQVMSINNSSDGLGANNVYVNNSLQAGSSLRAPIFYDSNDTGYYVDPNSTSNLSTVNIQTRINFNDTGGATTTGARIYYGDRGTLSTAATNATVINYGADGYGLVLESGYSGDGGGIKITDDGIIMWGAADENLLIVWDEDVQASRLVVDGSGNLYSYVSTRSPIYYDSNNTGYYADMAGTNYLYRVYGAADMRSPVFYDNNNTAYYANPNSRSNFYQLTLRGDSQTNYTALSSTGYNAVLRFDGDASAAAAGTPSWIPYLHWSNVQPSYGYRQHVSLGSYRDGGANWGDFYVGVGGNDSYATVFYRFRYTGDFTAPGEITAYSDARVKTNIERIENALDKVLQLNGYTYERTDLPPEEEDFRKKRYTGVIAQEVLKVLPEAVGGSEEHQYTVAYGNMVGLLIEAIKDQNTQVTELKEEIVQQNAIIETQKSIINTLTEKLDILIEKINNL